MLIRTLGSVRASVLDQVSLLQVPLLQSRKPHKLETTASIPLANPTTRPNTGATSITKATTGASTSSRRGPIHTLPQAGLPSKRPIRNIGKVATRSPLQALRPSKGRIHTATKGPLHTPPQPLLQTVRTIRTVSIPGTTIQPRLGMGRRGPAPGSLRGATPGRLREGTAGRRREGPRGSSRRRGAKIGGRVHSRLIRSSFSTRLGASRSRFTLTFRQSRTVCYQVWTVRSLPYRAKLRRKSGGRASRKRCTI